MDFRIFPEDPTRTTGDLDAEVLPVAAIQGISPSVSEFQMVLSKAASSRVPGFSSFKDELHSLGTMGPEAPGCLLDLRVLGHPAPKGIVTAPLQYC
eukprot:XP_006228013.1 PREDICTED: uncharacterized protein LOC501391 [Rattus norvegicus]